MSARLHARPKAQTLETANLPQVYHTLGTGYDLKQKEGSPIEHTDHHPTQ